MDDITDTPSGRFLLRIDPGLHAALRGAAADARLSLNEYVTRRLAAGWVVDAGIAEAVTRAAALVGKGLLGVVAFGSWARGETGESSDVDLLIVVDDSLKIERELYRLWDAEPLQVDSRPAEPHFVHLPAADARISSLWAEVAVDGIVLFERGSTVSRHLASLRRRILSGELTRRFAHGHAYWAGAS